MLERVWRKGNPLALLVGMQTTTPLWVTVWRFLKKTENRSTIWPSNPIAGHTHWRKQNWKRHMYPNVHCSVFSIAMIWQQPRHLLADDWIRKLWYIHAMEHYSAIENNASESILMRWMKPEPIIQSDVSQKEKHQYSILMHIYGI